MWEAYSTIVKDGGFDKLTIMGDNDFNVVTGDTAGGNIGDIKIVENADGLSDECSR